METFFPGAVLRFSRVKRETPASSQKPWHVVFNVRTLRPTLSIELQGCEDAGTCDVVATDEPSQQDTALRTEYILTFVGQIYLSKPSEKQIQQWSLVHLVHLGGIVQVQGVAGIVHMRVSLRYLEIYKTTGRDGNCFNMYVATTM